MKKHNRINTQQVSFHKVDESQAGKRIDNYLICLLDNVPKSRIYKILRSGEVRVNKGRVKPTYRLQPNDLIRLPPIKDAQETTEKPKNLDYIASKQKVAVLFEDDSLMIVNKPSGLAVHAGSGLDWGLIDLLRAQHPNIPDLELVHRLDRQTSGCLIISKKNKVLRDLHEALREGLVKKTYQCLVYGKWSKSINVVEAKLLKGQIAKNERVVKVHEDGKESKTTFGILARFPHATLMQASPKTGRTHQIRVHAYSQGHPILGDDKYATKESSEQTKHIALKRLFLHAWKIRFIHPLTGDIVNAEAPLPIELQNLLDRLND